MTWFYYRTGDDFADYVSSFEVLPDQTWRIYIVSRPGYEEANLSLACTYRTRSDGRYCVDGYRAPGSEAEARIVAALWADKAQEYIRSGNRPQGCPCRAVVVSALRRREVVTLGKTPW